MDIQFYRKKVQIDNETKWQMTPQQRTNLIYDFYTKLLLL